jgi:hypothetical protein
MKWMDGVKRDLRSLWAQLIAEQRYKRGMAGDKSRSRPTKYCSANNNNDLK